MPRRKARKSKPQGRTQSLPPAFHRLWLCVFFHGLDHRRRSGDNGGDVIRFLANPPEPWQSLLKGLETQDPDKDILIRAQLLVGPQ